MQLEVILRNSDMSRKKDLWYFFELEMEDIAEFGYLKRALSRAIAKLLDAYLGEDNNEGATIYTTAEKKNQMLRISYLRHDVDRVKVAIFVSKDVVTNRFVTTIQQHGREENRRDSSLIDYLHQHVTLGKNGKLANSLSKELNYMTNSNLSVKYEP